MANGENKPIDKLNSLNGIPISPGIVYGKVYVFKNELWMPELKEIDTTSIDIEINRFHNALSQCENELTHLVTNLEKIGHSVASDILSSQIMILNDIEFIESVKKVIKTEQINLESSIHKVITGYISDLVKLDNELFAQRATDIKDIGHRILEQLSKNISIKDGINSEKVILVTNEIFPSFVFRFGEEYILAIVTHRGGKTSHAAIIARTLGIPALSGVDIEKLSINTGDSLIVDGIVGKVTKNPSEEGIKKYNKAKSYYNNIVSSITEGKGAISVTEDGIPITIGANINKPDDIPIALENGACIIGLLRTEYFYITSETLPSEDDLFKHYSKLVNSLKGKELTIRLLDIGGDKKVSYLDLPEELNPFLGYRSIRYLIDHREIIMPQLKAILRVGYKGNVRILIPMLATLDELRIIKNFINEAINELEAQGLTYSSNVPLGSLIEVPSAALSVNKILKEVDFINIGSNDLLQYFVAADRGNAEVSNLYNWFNPTFLSLIGRVISRANRVGKLVGLCGEMGGSPGCLPILLGMGLQRISMNPGLIPIIKKMISTTSFFHSTKVFERVKQMDSSNEVALYISKLLKKKYPYAPLFDIYI